MQIIVRSEPKKKLGTCDKIGKGMRITTAQKVAIESLGPRLMPNLRRKDGLAKLKNQLPNKVCQ